MSMQEKSQTLQNIKPENVFRFFREICAIPHGSGNTKKISDYCAANAARLGLWFCQDEFKNVIIKKPASVGYEKHAPVILQGHLDMVCEKEADCAIDFENEGIRLLTDGDYIFADGTTLGGDDGIAVAMIMALLEDSTAVHPTVYAIFTSDEETGMTGAANIDLSDIQADILINIDSEEEGVLTVSCAGGAKCHLTIPFESELCHGNVFEIKVHGLSGGHSGVEIDKGIPNADIVAAGLLKALKQHCDFKLCNISGGLKDNAIPRECTVTVVTDMNHEEVISVCADYISELSLSLKQLPLISVSKCIYESSFNSESTNRIIEFLSDLPNGIIKMSDSIPGLVQTSLNLGILYCKSNLLYCTISVRSSDNNEKEALINNLKDIAHNYGGEMSVDGQYPAWEYRENSRLRECMVSVFERMFMEKPIIGAIHAGLECGLLSGKIKNLDAVSFGPDILDIHTPNERLDIKSTERMYNYLTEVLKEL